MEITKPCTRCEGTGFLSLSPKHGRKSPTLDEVKAILSEAVETTNRMCNPPYALAFHTLSNVVNSVVRKII